MIKPKVLSVLSLFAAAGLTAALSAAAAQTVSPASSPSGKHKMVSWVVLANSYLDFGVDVVRQKLDEVYPGEFLPSRQKGNFVVAGPLPGQFMIFSSVPGAAGIFMLNSVPGPYTHFSKFAEAIADPSLRASVAKQCCWLSVDLIHSKASDEEAYRFIEKVLAKIAPADAAFLVDPDTGAVMRFDDSVRSRFAKGEQIRSSP